MSEREPEQGPEDREILARLPRTRPGRRSPRRDEAAQAAERRAKRAAGAASAAGSGSSSERGGVGPTAPPRAEQPGTADALAGVARTGAAAVTGAVGLGIGIAGGALRAIRGAVERR
jgi:hypothetical protein